jgi:two-component system cell cycle response regulator
MMLDWTDVSAWTVLVVDDEPDNLEVLVESLEYYGLSVTQANNGAQALSLLQTFQPSLIILDLSMPQMDGWETRTRIKSNPATHNIPVIALSAHAMPGDPERAIAAGFDGYLTKPVSIPTLMDDLRAAIQGAVSDKKEKWQVLVVEDELDSMELVHGILEYHGLQPLGAATGSEALVVLGTTIPDLIIIDLSLPDIDGWTLLKKIISEEKWRNIPRVAVTAYHNPMLAQQAIEAGFQAYFPKPIDTTSFVRELQAIIDR